MIKILKNILSKAYFDTKEYKRASHVLKGCTSQKAIFLGDSLYLVFSLIISS